MIMELCPPAHAEIAIKSELQACNHKKKGFNRHWLKPFEVLTDAVCASRSGDQFPATSRVRTIFPGVICCFDLVINAVAVVFSA